MSDGRYVQLPLEKMAGLLLYRIAQGQVFENGNKRTALMSCFFFLRNNGYELKINEDEVNNLLWGFAKSEEHPDLPAKYNQADAEKYVYDNITVRRWVV